MSDQPSTKILKLLIIFVILVAVMKNLTGSGFFEPKDYKARGFQVDIPVGWTKVKPEKGFTVPHGTEFAQFIPKGYDLESGPPPALITVLSKRLETPIWIEDEFVNILGSLREAGYDIKDKGDLKLDDKVSSWVVYYDKKTQILTLEFYLVTDNNIFIKLQYAADPDEFARYRPSFEEMRESFKFRFSL